MQEAAGEYHPEAMDVEVPQVAPGCVQLSSGRIARPTSKTAPSRASSAELSETCPSDGGCTVHLACAQRLIDCVRRHVCTPGTLTRCLFSLSVYIAIGFGLCTMWQRSRKSDLAHLLQRARRQGQSARAGGRAGLRRRPPSAGAWWAACSRQLAQPRLGSSAPSAERRYCFFASWHMQRHLVGHRLCYCGMHCLAMIHTPLFCALHSCSWWFEAMRIWWDW